MLKLREGDPRLLGLLELKVDGVLLQRRETFQINKRIAVNKLLKKSTGHIFCCLDSYFAI